MTCNDCGKELKGGFGIGERPFSKFRCAACTIVDVENAQAVWGLKKIIEMLETPILANGRNYKAQSWQHYEQKMRCVSLAKLLVENK